MRPSTWMSLPVRRAACAVRMKEDSGSSAFCTCAGAAAASSSTVARICADKTTDGSRNFTDSSRSTGMGPWYL